MASNFKAVIFDLGGVLLEWDRHSVATVTAKQLVTIMNSAVWYELERGNLTVQQACDVRHEGILNWWFVTDIP